MWKPRDFVVVPLTLAVAGGGLFWGGRNTYRTLRNWSPEEISCADYIAHPPAKDWVRLTGCQPDSDRLGIETLHREGTGGAPATSEQTGIYIPLAATGIDNGRVKIVLFVDHGRLLALADKLATDAQVQEAFGAFAHPIEGMRQDALDMSRRDREDLQGLHMHLADDFAVIALDARPRPLWLGAGALALGLGASGLIIRRRRRREKPVEIAKARIVTLGVEEADDDAS
jgi:hypothetical protein